MKKYILVFILSSLFITAPSKVSLATTIVVIVTSDFVILGVDSKVVINDALTGKASHIEDLKLFKSGNYYFATSGVLGTMGNLNTFSTIIAKYLKDSINFNEAITKANAEVRIALIRNAEDLKQKMPTYYDSEYIKKTLIFSYAVIGIKAGKPFAYNAQFVLKSTAPYDLSVLEQEFPLATTKGNEAKAFYIGEHAEIDEYVKTSNIYSKHPDIIVEELINVEIKAKPDKVGPPINIVKMTKQGETIWIKRSNGCPRVLN